MQALDTAAYILRGAHIASGFTALFSMGIPLVAKKGGAAHRRFGSVYVSSMFVAATAAMALAPVRMLQRPQARWTVSIFLAYLGVMSFASCFYGVRVLRQKRRDAPHTHPLDLRVPVVLGLSAVAIAAYGLTVHHLLSVLFAPLGLLVAVPQWKTLRSVPTAPRWWLWEHMRAVLISCIGTVTAFLVVNVARFVPHGAEAFVWMAPPSRASPS